MNRNAPFEPDNGDFVKFIDEIHGMSAHNAAVNKAIAEEKLNGGALGPDAAARSMSRIRRQHDSSLREIRRSNSQTAASIKDPQCAHNADFSAGQSNFNRPGPGLHSRDSSFQRSSRNSRRATDMTSRQERFTSRESSFDSTRRSFERSDSGFTSKDSSFYAHNAASDPQARTAARCHSMSRPVKKRMGTSFGSTDQSAGLYSSGSSSCSMGSSGGPMPSRSAPAGSSTVTGSGTGGSGSLTGLKGQNFQVRPRNNAGAGAAAAGSNNSSVNGQNGRLPNARKDNRFLPIIMFWTMGALMLFFGNFDIDEALPVIVFMFFVPVIVLLQSARKNKK